MTDLNTTLHAHLEAICAIGPRRPGGDAEAHAADYVREALAKLGLEDVRSQPFPAPGGRIWKTAPPLIAILTGIMLGNGRRLSQFVGGNVLLFGLWALNEAQRGVSLVPPFGEMGTSQNVIARIAPKGKTEHFLYLVAHLDSGKQPVVPPAPSGASRMLRTIGLGMGLDIASLTLLAALIGRRRLGRRYRALGFIVALGALLLALLEHNQPDSDGANEGAVGVATLLTLAERLKAEPLEHTEVVLLVTGAQTTLNDGIQAFVDRYAPPRDFSSFIEIEATGYGDPCYVSEQGLSLLSASHSTPQLTALAAKMARQHPELRVTGASVPVLNQVNTLVREGYEALCISSTGAASAQDTLATVDEDSAGRAAEYTLRLARAVDEKFGV